MTSPAKQLAEAVRELDELFVSRDDTLERYRKQRETVGLMIEQILSAPDPQPSATVAEMRQVATGFSTIVLHGYLLRWADHLEAAERRCEKAEAFKAWVHLYLDSQGVPHHPPGIHGSEGCRIGDRMDWLMARIAELESRQPAPLQSVEVDWEALGREVFRSFFPGRKWEWQGKAKEHYRMIAKAVIEAYETQRSKPSEST